MTPFVGPLHGLRGASASQSDDLDTLKTLIDDGKVGVTLDRRFGLGEAAEALAYLASGQARGIVITP
jgi:NADPH:quinone reductase-like Zn-dependent oxidoreductase